MGQDVGLARELSGREERLEVGLVPGLRVDVGQQPRLAVSGGFTQWLIVHVIEGNTALLLHGGRRRRDEQGVHRANGPVRRVAVGKEVGWREVLLRSVNGVGGHSWRDGGRGDAIWALVTAQFRKSGRVVDARCHGCGNGNRGHLLRPVGVAAVDGRHHCRHRQLRDRSGGERLRHRVGGWREIGKWETRNMPRHRSMSDRRRGRGQDWWKSRDHGVDV